MCTANTSSLCSGGKSLKKLLYCYFVLVAITCSEVNAKWNLRHLICTSLHMWSDHRSDYNPSHVGTSADRADVEMYLQLFCRKMKTKNYLSTFSNHSSFCPVSLPQPPNWSLVLPEVSYCCKGSSSFLLLPSACSSGVIGLFFTWNISLPFNGFTSPLGSALWSVSRHFDYRRLKDYVYCFVSQVQLSQQIASQQSTDVGVYNINSNIMSTVSSYLLVSRVMGLGGTSPPAEETMLVRVTTFSSEFPLCIFLLMERLASGDHSCTQTHSHLLKVFVFVSLSVYVNISDTSLMKTLLMHPWESTKARARPLKYAAVAFS